jgi:prepilin-type N-terminal cleavage/methylation domain-containing protein
VVRVTRGPRSDRPARLRREQVGCGRWRDRDQRGFTVVELLVAVLLLGIVGTVVTSAVVTGLRTSRVTTERTMALHDLEIALQRVGRELRMADPLYLTDGTDYGTVVGAEVVQGRAVHVVRFAVQDGDDGVQRLVQDTTSFDLDAWVSGTTDEDAQPTSRVLVTAIDNGTAPVFTYFDRENNPIVCDATTEDKADCDDRYAEATQIGVELVREVDGQDPVRASTRINVRNTRYGS